MTDLMEMLKDSHRVIELGVVDTGRRRRWSSSEKLRIVEESLSGPRLASVTARRYGISNQLLFSWRKAYREGRLGACQVDGFVPARIMPDVPLTTEPAAPIAHSNLEIVTANGRRVIVDHTVDVEVLLRIMRGLETLP